MDNANDNAAFLTLARQLHSFHLESEDCKKEYGVGIPNSTLVQSHDIQLAARYAPLSKDDTKVYPLVWAKNPHLLQNDLDTFRNSVRELSQDRPDSTSLEKPVNEKPSPHRLDFIMS